MQPSSLVFLLIVGVWAAYFVHYWVRRRDHLATARSVDALSESLRILGRRGKRPGTTLTRPDDVPLLHGTRRRVTATVSAPSGASMSTTSSSSVLSASSPALSAPAVAAPGRPPVPRMRPRRSVRGLTFLAGLFGTVVVAVLAGLGVLQAWTPLLPVLVAVGGFLWLRAGVRAQSAARRAVLAQRRAGLADRTPDAARRASPGTARGAAARTFPVADRPTGADVSARAAATAEATSFPGAAAAVGGSAPVAATAGDEATAATVGVEPSPSGPALPEVDEDDIPLTWDPVPVPRPTYTMKATARTRVAPADGHPPADVDDRDAADALGPDDAAGEQAAYPLSASRPRRAAGA